MPTVRATANLERTGSPDRDDVQNVFHVVTPAGNQTPFREALSVSIAGFYSSLAGLLSPVITRNALVHEVRLAEVAPGGMGEDDDVVSPVVHTHRFSLTTAPLNNHALPSEAGIAISFEGDTAGLAEEVGDTRPAARRRGRIFFGPLISPFGAVIGGEVRITPEIRTQLLDAFEVLHGELEVGGMSLRVYSRANATTYPVVRAWVDNAFDIQRRRGSAATERTVRNLT